MATRRQRSLPAAPRIADFQVCCWQAELRLAGFQTSVPSANPMHPALPRPADLEIGDTAGLETCGTPQPRRQLRKLLCASAKPVFSIVHRPSSILFACRLAALVLFLFGAVSAHAQTNTPATTTLGPLSISLGANSGAPDIDSGIKILFLITLLSLAPSILLLMTCFTRVAIVLGFVRSALQLQGSPSSQIIVGLSLFITFFVMAPVWDNINRDALEPYQAHKITSQQALDAASGNLRDFMLKQTRPKDVELFVSMAKLPPTKVEDLPLRVVTPAFIISELRTAFQMGFLIYVPFILIDIVVATVLMSMGMMMMPPTTISLPLKLLLFVLVDGWSLIVQSLVRSFGM